MALKGIRFNGETLVVPQEYVKSAEVSGNSITLTDSEGNKINFTPQKPTVDTSLSITSKNAIANSAVSLKLSEFEESIVPNIVNSKILENNNSFINDEIDIVGQKNFSIVGLIGREISTTETKTYPVESYSVENLSTTYTFTLNDSGYYESGNNGVNNSWSLCKLSFVMSETGDLEFEIINSGESNYDFGIFSQIDQTLTDSYTEDTSSTLVYKSYKGQSSTSPVTLTYSDISAGEHFITIKFRKDSSSSSGNDSLQFKVISNVGTYEETTTYNKINTIITDENDNILYEGKVLAFAEDIPTKTSQLTNNSNFVSDSLYVHTDNNYTNSDKTKLEGIDTTKLVLTEGNQTISGMKTFNSIVVANSGVNAKNATVRAGDIVTQAINSTDGLTVMSWIFGFGEDGDSDTATDYRMFFGQPTSSYNLPYKIYFLGSEISFEVDSANFTGTVTVPDVTIT